VAETAFENHLLKTGVRKGRAENWHV